MSNIAVFSIFPLVIMMIIRIYDTQTKIFDQNYTNLQKILLYRNNLQEFIFISGKNVILKFSSQDLHTPIDKHHIGPVNHSILCARPNMCPMSLCSPELQSQDKCFPKMTDVYVKTWTISKTYLIVCYNVYQGYCETIDLTGTFSSSSKSVEYSIVTNDLNSQATILHFNDKVYVAIEINPVLNIQSIDFNTYSIRSLSDLKIIKDRFGIFHLYYGRLGGGPTPIYPLEFKGSFHIRDNRIGVVSNDYIFFLVNQPENKAEPKNGKFQIRLVRICAEDVDFSSFIDVGLNCENDRIQTYYQIDSWSLSSVSESLANWYRSKTRFPNLKSEPEANFNQILYLNLKIIEITNNYKKTLNSFVICAYPIAEIMELFDIVKKSCLNGHGSVNAKPYDVNSREESCNQDDTNPKRGYCSSKVINSHIIGDHLGEDSGIGHKVMAKQGTRGISMCVFPVYESYTMAVVSGSDGVLYKFELFEDKYRDLGSKQLLPGKNFSIQINEANTIIYALSDSKIITHELNFCDNQTNCESCVHINPFCGWCISDGRCSVRDKCAPFAWIKYNRDSEINMCPKINYLPNHSILEYSNNIPIINFKIDQISYSILDKNDQYLNCQYFTNENILITTAKAIYFPTNNSISCSGPPKTTIPPISESQNFVSLKLKVLMRETFLVEGVYTIYNCAQSKSCSLCTENKFNCTWCIRNNLCIPANTGKCKKNMEVLSHSSNNCPKLEPSNNILAFPVNSKIEIDLSIKNVQNYFDFKTEFLCFETCSNSSVVANFSESTAILRCVFSKIKTLQNGISTCVVNVAWRKSNMLEGSFESIIPVKFQVFDCSLLSQFCDDCVLLPAAYQCGFCSPTKQCVQRNKCQYDKWISHTDDTCPSPIILKIHPENATFYSETTIVIKGRNLGFSEKDIENSISLENAKIRLSCKLILSSYVSAKEFKCTIQNITDRIETPVTFQFIFRSKLSYLAKKEFHFYTPKIISVEPSSGPFIGGTIIKIFGIYLNIGNKREIYFKSNKIAVQCEIIENLDNLMVCRINSFISYLLKRSNSVFSATLQLRIDSHVFNFNNIIFNFVPNPYITKISRNRVLSKGGQDISIFGHNLQYINKPSLAFYCGGNLSQFEECGNNTEVHCVTPKNVYSFKPQECQFQFGMEKGTVSLYNTTITIYPEPKFKRIPNKKNLPSTSFSFVKRKLVNEKLTLTFEMENQNYVSAFVVPDIRISIGSLNCTNITLSGNVIECNIVINQINTHQKYSANVTIGKNINMFLGYINFIRGDIVYDTPTLLIIGIIIIFLLAIIIVIIVLLVKNSKANRTKSNLDYITMKNTNDETREIIKQGIAELNQTAFQEDIHKNWCDAPIYPYNVYILYNFFPNTHPRLCKESKAGNEWMLNLVSQNYNSNDPTTHPLIFNKQIQVIENTVEYSRKLSKLFEDELFVLVFFSLLEDDEEVDSKKSDIVSFLSLILMKDMSNYTKILKLLIKAAYDSRKANEEERSLFRQSDLLSKLLSNWFFILMYDHLQNKNAGGDLLILYLNILNVINSGAVNLTTNQSQYSLNENSLLDRKIGKKLKLKVKHDIKDTEEELDIVVLDCDCITQVKLKIFECIYKYIPYSKWQNVDNYDLIRVNEDQTTETEHLMKTILKEQEDNIYKTLRHYGIKDGDTLKIVYNVDSIPASNTGSFGRSSHIESNSASLKTNRSRNITRDISTINFTPDMIKHNPVHEFDKMSQENISEKSKLKCCQKPKTKTHKDSGNVQQICLLYTHILKTKIEQQIRNVFDDIFDIDSVPPCINDLFVYLNNICKDENVVFAVKSNSLILRFWIQLINNIDFLFDIPLLKHTPVLECLKCISRILMDICSENQNKDAWLTHIFSDLIKIYSPQVVNYYEGIKNAPTYNYNDFYSATRIDGINISLAIVILYQNYIKNVHDKLVHSIETSNYPKDKQTEWINILQEVNILYVPENLFGEENGDIRTTVC